MGGDGIAGVGGVGGLEGVAVDVASYYWRARSEGSCVGCDGQSGCEQGGEDDAGHLEGA